MTLEQQQKIKVYELQLKENCKRYENYGGNSVCNISLFESQDLDDKNITAQVTAITGLSDNQEPFIAVKYFLIEPSGNSFVLEDVFPDEDVNEYVGKLKRIK